MKAYPKYKPSNIEWIGEIPEHWELKKLKFSINYLKGKNPKELVPNKLNNKFYPYLSMGYLRGNEKDIQYSEVSNNLVLINEGDLLLLWDGSNAGEFISGKEGILSSTMAKINIISDYDKNFFFYVSKAIERQLKDLTKGMGIPHVETNVLNNLLLPMLSSNEQNTISHYLEDRTQKIDTLIEKKQKLIDLLKEERTATINQAVTKGLNLDVPMKDSGIEWLGEIPEHWEMKRLKYVAEINRNTLNQNTDSDYEFQYIDIGNVTLEGLTHPPQLMKFKDAPSRARRVVKKGDTIVSTVRTYLKAIAYIEDKADNIIGSTGFAVLTSNGILNSKYLYYLMINEKIIDLINSLSTGVSYPAINSSDLANIVIGFPKEIKEQQTIINFIEYEISKTNHTLIKIEKEIELLQEYRIALISEVVTGKIDVREAV